VARNVLTYRGLTSLTRHLARSSPTASTTWPPMRVGSASGLRPTRPNSQFSRSAPGTNAWAARAIRKPVR
jgi:hypothetical protein